MRWPPTRPVPFSASLSSRNSQRNWVGWEDRGGELTTSARILKAHISMLRFLQAQAHKRTHTHGTKFPFPFPHWTGVNTHTSRNDSFHVHLACYSVSYGDCLYEWTELESVSVCLCLPVHRCISQTHLRGSGWSWLSFWKVYSGLRLLEWPQDVDQWGLLPPSLPPSLFPSLFSSVPPLPFIVTACFHFLYFSQLQD